VSASAWALNLREVPMLIPENCSKGGVYMSTNNVPIKPIADYIVVVQEAAQAKTTSGLYIPTSSQEKTAVMEVVAVGDKVTSVKVGEKVIVRDDYSNNKNLTIDKTNYILVPELNVIAKV
jgi:co-chaperonin GroES (HSP10)